MGVGERRFLDSVPICFSGVPDTVTAGKACRGVTDFALIGLLCCCCVDDENSLPSCLLATLLGEHALGSSAPRARRLTGDAAFIFGW